MADWHTRYRRIIDAYRTALQHKHPIMCQHVDAQVESWGEGWVTSEAPSTINQWMTAQEISKHYGINVPVIRAWYRRHPDEIQRTERDRRVYYWLADVLRYQAKRA